MSLDLEQYIASIPDFPVKGIMFRDVTPLIDDPDAFHETIDRIIDFGHQVNADLIAGPESRGFVFGCPAAYAMHVGFALVRKPGKLPRETVSCKYALEYGTDELFMHKDSVKPGQRVLVVDDLLATGGTALATAHMIEEMGGTVAGFVFVIELSGLPGRETLKDYNVLSMMTLSDK